MIKHRKSFLIILCFFSLLSSETFLYAQTDEDIEGFIEAGKKCYRRGMLNEAALEFENALIDYAYIGRRNKDTNFGLLAGMIDNESTVDNVKLSGKIMLGAITPDICSINLIANGVSLSETAIMTA